MKETDKLEHDLVNELCAYSAKYGSGDSMNLDEMFATEKKKVVKSKQIAAVENQMQLLANAFHDIKKYADQRGFSLEEDSNARKLSLAPHEVPYTRADKDWVDSWFGYNPGRAPKLVDPAVAIAKAYYRCSREYNALRGERDGLLKGEQGEAYVQQQLELLHGEYPYLQNVKFMHEDSAGRTSETDLFVMTSKGLLVCEIKNKGNEKYIIKISKDGQWTKNDSRGNFLSVDEKSPFAQNTRHCIAAKRVLESEGFDNIKVIPVVIIANEFVRIENDSDNKVIRASEIYNCVEGLPYPEKYDREMQNKVLAALQKHNVEAENAFDVRVYNPNLREDLKSFIDYQLDKADARINLYKQRNAFSMVADKVKKQKEMRLRKYATGLSILVLISIVALIILGRLWFIDAVFMLFLWLLCSMSVGTEVPHYAIIGLAILELFIFCNWYILLIMSWF